MEKKKKTVTKNDNKRKEKHGNLYNVEKEQLRKQEKRRETYA